MRKKALFLLTSSMFLVACSTPSTQHASVAKVGADKHAVTNNSGNNKSTARSVSSPHQHYDQVTAGLLQDGHKALADNRLLTPEGDNANLYFQVVFGRDPGNYQATLGIAEIIDRYLAWSVAGAQRQDFETAQTYLRRARVVNADDPTIATVQQRVGAMQQQAPSKTQTTSTQAGDSVGVYYLPKALFDHDDDFVLAKIQPIIDEVERTRRAIQINWSNDQESRLLYRIINSRTPEFRVRAMIERNAKHSVEVKDN